MSETSPSDFVPTASFPRRLFLFSEYGTLNGGEHSFLAHLPHLHSAGWQLTAALPSPSPFATELEKQGATVVPFSFYDSTQTRHSLSTLRERLWHVLEKESPDVVHCNSLHASRIAGPLSSRSKIPILGYLRDILKLRRQVIDDLNQLNQLVSVSNATKHWHVQQGLHADRIQVIYNGVATDTFFPQTATGWLHQELGLPREHRLLLTIGQIGMRKGLDVIVDALAPVFSQNPTVHWIVIGERHSQKAEAVDYHQQLLQATSQAPLKDRVHWLGRRPDIARIMNEADLLIHAARQEPLGRVLLEALACGLPIVATPVGGTPEIFRNISDGATLFPADDVPALTQAIQQALSISRNASLSAQLHQTAKQRFSPSQTAQQLSALYQKLLVD